MEVEQKKPVITMTTTKILHILLDVALAPVLVLGGGPGNRRWKGPVLGSSLVKVARIACIPISISSHHEIVCIPSL